MRKKGDSQAPAEEREAAFQTYLDIGNLREVARIHERNRTTVSKWAMQDDWRKRREDIIQKARIEGDQKQVDQRGRMVQAYRALFSEAFRRVFNPELSSGQRLLVDPSLQDLDRLTKTLLSLEGESSEIIEVRSGQMLLEFANLVIEAVNSTFQDAAERERFRDVLAGLLHKHAGGSRRLKGEDEDPSGKPGQHGADDLGEGTVSRG